jgi:dihydroflavonol-4-reductase
MDVLVTGATGFVGSQLCRALVERGDRVRAFHRATSSLVGLEGLEVEHFIGDLTQPETLAPAMQGAEAVFHTAAQLGGVSDLRLYQTVTVAGTRAVLEAARTAGVRRVVHTSSVAALGVPETGQGGANAAPTLLDEHHTWNYVPERWPYGYAKYLAELEVQKAVAQGLEVVIVNPGYVLGAGDVYRQSSSLITTVAEGRLAVTVAGGLNVVHIDDVVAGHLAALERGCPGERYILGGQNMTYTHLLALAAQATGVRAPATQLPTGLVRMLSTPARWVRSFVKLPVGPELLALAGYYFYFDTRKAHEILALSEPRQIEDAIREAYAWSKSRG